MRHQPTTLVVTLAGLPLLVILLVHLLPFHPAVSYTLVFITASLAYVLFASVLRNTEVPTRLLAGIVFASVLVRLSFIGAMPVGSDDVYRYMWDGKVQSHGVNPYRFAPVDPHLQPLHTPLLPSAVNHPDMKSLYFPVSQWVFFAAYQISGEEIWGYKLLLIIAEIAAIVVLLLFAVRFNVPRRFVLLYAVCPLPILQFGVDAHLDGIGLPLLAASLLFYFSRRRALGLVMLGLSISIKPVGLIILPVLFFLEKRPADKLRVVLIPALLVVLQFIPYLASAHPFDPLMTFTQHWVFNGGLFTLLNLFLANNQTTRLVCALLLAGALILLSFSARAALEKVYYAVLLLLLCSPVVHPWYVTWVAVLLPLVRMWSGVVFVSSVSLASFTTLTYQLSGRWVEYPLVAVLEYLPVVILLARELFWRKDTTLPAERSTGLQEGTRSAI